MAIRLTDPLHTAWSYVWDYLHGEDIKRADARAVALETAARASGSGLTPVVEAAVSPVTRATDRRRM